MIMSSKYVSQIITITAIVTSFLQAQSQTSIINSNRSVLEQATKISNPNQGQISYRWNPGIYADIGRQDDGTYYNRYRTRMIFPFADIPRDARVNWVKLYLTIWNYPYGAGTNKAKIVKLPASYGTDSDAWSQFDNSQTVYFNNLQYDQMSNKELTDPTLTTDVTNAIHSASPTLTAGIMSLNEAANNTNAQVTVSIWVNWTPAVTVTVQNSFGGGNVEIDGGTKGSPWTSGQGGQPVWYSGDSHNIRSYSQTVSGTSYPFLLTWTNLSTQEVKTQSSENSPVTITPTTNATWQANFGAGTALVTVINSFGAGNVKVDGGTYASGTQFGWSVGSQHTLEAITGQMATQNGLTYQYNYLNWQKDSDPTDPTNPKTISVGASSIYKANFDAQVNVNGTVTVGTATISASRVVFWPNAKLLVTGVLTAVGTPAQHIVFAPADGYSYYQGIEFSGHGADNSSLQYCDINYASMPIKATNTSNLTISNVAIANSNFYNGGDDAAMAFYNSSPTISSTMVNGRWDSWNGVRFASGSTGTLQGSYIQNCAMGNGIVIQGGSSPTISGNYITNNHYHGIVEVGNGGGFARLYGNFMTNNGASGYVGIVLDNSDGEARDNYISGSAGGVYSWYYSFLQTTGWESPYLQGGNHITNTNLGLQSYYYSTIQWGLVFEDDYYRYFYGACNNISGNVYNASNVEGSTMMVRGNWWGTPDYNQALATMGWYNASPPDILYLRQSQNAGCLPEPLGGCLECVSATVGTEEDSPDGTLRQALKALFMKQYDNAIALYKNILSNGSNPLADRRKALVGLYHVFRRSKNRNLISDMANHKALGPMASELLASMHVAAGEFSEAEAIANSLKQNNSGTDAEKRALILLAGLGGFDPAYKAKSSAALSELRQKFGSTVDAGILVALGGSGSLGSKSASQATAEQSGDDLSSFPNPFNPSTRIQYRLASDGPVSLKVYDVLGREVVSLVDEVKSAGTYTVTWDASRLPSGIYFTRLETAGKALVKKIMLVK